MIQVDPPRKVELAGITGACRSSLGDADAATGRGRSGQKASDEDGCLHNDSAREVSRQCWQASRPEVSPGVRAGSVGAEEDRIVIPFSNAMRRPTKGPDPASRRRNCGAHCVEKSVKTQHRGCGISAACMPQSRQTDIRPNPDSNISQPPHHTAGLKRAKVFQMTVTAASPRAQHVVAPKAPQLQFVIRAVRGASGPGVLLASLDYGIWRLQ